MEGLLPSSGGLGTLLALLKKGLQSHCEPLPRKQCGHYSS